MGAQRQLKKPLVSTIGRAALAAASCSLAAKRLQEEHWQLQQAAGMNLVPCNDFSFYDHVLDMTLLLGDSADRCLYPVVTDSGERRDRSLFCDGARLPAA